MKAKIQHVVLLITGISLATFQFASTAFAEGGWIGGGGDPRSQHFAKAKLETPEILSRLSESSLRSPLIDAAIRAALPAQGNSDAEKTSELIAKVKEFTLKNKVQIQEDIRNSSLEWQEPALSETPKCAYTQLGKLAAPIKLSFTSCVGIANSTDAGRVLVHESVHHIDVQASEVFADLVSIAVFTAWENLLVTGIPMCPGAYAASHYAEDGTVRFLERGDQALATLKPTESLHWYNSNRHMVGKWQAALPGQKTPYHEFTNDESVLQDLPGIGRCANLAGTFRFNRIFSDGREVQFEYPYVLVNDASGQAKIIYFRPRHGRPYGDQENFMFSLIRNDTRSDWDDVLYRGGDFPGESWHPMVRVQ